MDLKKPIEEDNYTKRHIYRKHFRRRTYRHFRGTEIFVLPSIAEDSPLALLEAMSCGIPVISTTVEEI